MATRSKVGFKNADGTVNASYVHFDGYLDGVGVALHLNHDSDSKAKKLGYAKGIRSIELDSPVSYYNDMENETYESEDAFHDAIVKDFDYGYLYDPSRGWLFTSSKYGTNDFIELEDQLMYDELLPGSGEYVGDLEENVSISKLKEIEVGVVDKTQDEEEMGLEEIDGMKAGIKKGKAAGAKDAGNRIKEDEENEGQDAINMASAEINEDDDDFIQKGFESGEIKAGGLKKSLGIPKDEKIPAGLINKKLAQLKKKDKDKGEKGIQGLSKADRKLQKQLNLAKTFKKMDEIHDPARGNTLKEHFKRFTK